MAVLHRLAVQNARCVENNPRSLHEELNRLSGHAEHITLGSALQAFAHTGAPAGGTYRRVDKGLSCW